MNSRRKLKTVLLMFGLALLVGAGIFGYRLLTDRREAADSSVQHGAKDQNKREDDEHGTDNPDGAFRFRRLQMQDEKGEIPPDALVKAHQHVTLMKAEQQRRLKARQQSRKPQQILEGGIASDSWTWLGPGNIGGRMRTIVIHPTNPNTMWVGSVGGGIWRSDNGGGSWQPVNDFMSNLAVSTMVINPANTNIMYAGTGESFAGYSNGPPDGNGFTPDGIKGLGVFQSGDGGVTWNRLASTANATWDFVNRLAISPNGNTILGATNTGIQRSVNAGVIWTAGGGVNGTILDIDFHPTDAQMAIASGNGAAWYSTNGGQNWSAAVFRIGAVPTTISGRVEVAYAPSSPTTVYASVNQNNGDIYQSLDGGKIYTRVNTGTNFFLGAGNQGNYDNIIWVNPQDATLIIVGGIDLWRSTNSGATFTRISQWQSAPGSSAHADHHMIVAHPGFNNTTNRIAYFGNDGGLYRANDASTVVQTGGWTNLNNSLGITQFYGAAGNFTTDAFGNPAPVIVGGTQDNGTLAYTGSTNWGIGREGDGGYCAADPIDPVYYGEYIYLTIYRSLGGSPFSYGDIFFGIGDANNAATANFIAPFILDPNNSNTMLAGGISLWRSNDVKSFIPAPTWAAIKQPLPPDPTNNNAIYPISAIAISPSTSTFIVVGHNNGDIFLTFNGTDASPNWTKIDPPAPALPNRFVTRLTIDSTRSPSWIYATFGGFSGDNVYRTTNFGATWTDITGTGATGLPDVPVRSLVFHPRNANFLYVGTEVGVFTSDDAGATWELPQNGPANVSVDELFWLGGDLIAATHGRGLYRASGGTYVDCNYNGGNGASIGTFERPFKTVAAAVNAATTYRIIWIKPCHYDEKFLLPNNAINKHLEIRSLGGTALIGKP